MNLHLAEIFFFSGCCLPPRHAFGLVGSDQALPRRKRTGSYSTLHSSRRSLHTPCLNWFSFLPLHFMGSSGRRSRSRSRSRSEDSCATTPPKAPALSLTSTHSMKHIYQRLLLPFEDYMEDQQHQRAICSCTFHDDDTWLGQAYYQPHGRMDDERRYYC